MRRGLMGFTENIIKLKKVPRKGWVSQVGVENPESVADHSFGCALLAMYLGDLKGLDTEKLVRLSLLHDFHEALIGDYDAFDKQRIGEEKAKKNQQKAISEVFAALPPQIREKYCDLSEEYLRQETPEAKLVKQIDKLEMVLQARDYEKQGYDRGKLQVFWEGVDGAIVDSDLEAIITRLKKQRK